MAFILSLLDSPTAWVAVFLTETLLLSFALGNVGSRLLRFLDLPGISRFLIGFCASPFFIGGWMGLIALVFPGSSRWVFLLSLSAFSLILLGLLGKQVIMDAVQSARESLKKWRKQLYNTLLVISLVLVVLRLLPVMVHNARAPIINYDASQYLSEGLEFAKYRNLASLDVKTNVERGITINQYHGSMWSLYLGFALMHTTGDFGYPNDQAARVGIQVVYLFMLASVFALAYSSRSLIVGLLSVLLVLQVGDLSYFSVVTSDRDSYRIIGLVLHAAVMIGLVPKISRSEFKAYYAIPLLFTATFSVVGHITGALYVTLITVTFGIWALVAYRKKALVPVLFVAVFTAVGVLIGGSHIISNLLTYGQMTIPCPNIPGHITSEGWQAGAASLYERTWNVQTGLSQLPEFVWELINRNGVGFGILGFVCLVIPFFLRERKLEPLLGYAKLFSLISLVFLVPMLGVFDFMHHYLSSGYVYNRRYILHLYPFMVVNAALVLYCVYSILKNRFVVSLTWKKFIPAGIALLTGGVIAISAYYDVSTIRKANWTQEWYPHVILPLEAAVHEMEPGKRVFLTYGQENYYLYNQAVVFGGCETFAFNDMREEMAWDLIDKYQIGAVAFKTQNIEGLWEHTALYEIATDPQYAVFMGEDEEDYFASLSIYLLRDSMQYLEHVEEWMWLDIRDSISQQVDFSNLSLQDGQYFYSDGYGNQVRLEGDVMLVDAPVGSGKAYEFGTNNRIVSLSSQLRKGQGTVALWFNADAEDAARSVLLSVEGDLLTIVREGDNFTVVLNGVEVGTIELDAGAGWQQIAVTWEESAQFVYLNGESVLQQGIPLEAGDDETTLSFAIGGYVGNQEEGDIWRGAVGQFTLYDRALAPEEINLQYNVTKK